METCEKLGKKFRKKLKAKFNTSKTSDLVAHAVYVLGGDMVNETFPGLEVLDSKHFTISPPAYTSPIRDHFFYMKFVAYVLLFQPEPGGYMTPGDKEPYCNRFAAAFLLPQKKVLKLLKKGYGTQMIAVHFEVDTDLVEERLKYVHL